MIFKVRSAVDLPLRIEERHISEHFIMRTVGTTCETKRMSAPHRSSESGVGRCDSVCV